MSVDTTPDSAAPSAASGRRRFVELDVIRAVALIGVVFNNYYGYLLIECRTCGDYRTGGVLDPWTGWFSTRFAATFVLVAGVGTTLLTRSARAGDVVQRVQMSNVLLIRGAMLLVGGWALEQIWNGTILPYYGLFFMAAAVLSWLSSRALVAVAAVAVLFAAWIPWYLTDHPTATWPVGGNWQSLEGALKQLVFDGTHPFFPWIAFFVIGMLIGRAIERVDHIRLGQLSLLAMCAAFVVYNLWSDTPLQRMFTSVSPYGEPFGVIPGGRALGYTVATGAAAVAAFVIVGWLARRGEHWWMVRGLAAAGRMTLTLYVLHALVFRVLVVSTDVIQPDGMRTALWLTAVFWVTAIVAATLWQRYVGIGPLEWVYRTVSNTAAPGRRP